MNDITIVTAFYDIGRASWTSIFKRSAEEYIRAFSNLLNFNYRILVFVDKRHIESVKNLVDSSKNPSNTTLVPIDESWLKKNIWAWSRLDIEREIMASEQYQSLISNRIRMQYPENVVPEYTILTHSKIDFLYHAIENNLVDSKFTMWLDFGYLSQRAMSGFLPNKNLDSSKMIEGKIILCCLNGGITIQDTDIIYTLKTAPEKIAAGLFIGDKESIKKFREICHECLIEYQKMFIADDEQALWIQCLIKNPYLFCQYMFSDWYDSLKYFTKD